jgi:hypothetical protein
MAKTTNTNDEVNVMVLLYTNTLTYQWVSEAAQVGNARRESCGGQARQAGERRWVCGGLSEAGKRRAELAAGRQWDFFAFFNGHRSRFYNRW